MITLARPTALAGRRDSLSTEPVQLFERFQRARNLGRVDQSCPLRSIDVASREAVRQLTRSNFLAQQTDGGIKASYDAVVDAPSVSFEIIAPCSCPLGRL